MYGCSNSVVRARRDLMPRAGEVLGLAGLVGAGRTELGRVLFWTDPGGYGENFVENGNKINDDFAARGGGARHRVCAGRPPSACRHLEMPIAQNMTMAISPKNFPGHLAALRRGAATGARLYPRPGDQSLWAGSSPGGSPLSGGNQQKVSLARWLATKPKAADFGRADARRGCRGEK